MPMRPTLLMSPWPAMPTTSIAKMSGATTHWMSRRKMSERKRICTASFGASKPSSAPTTIATNIQTERLRRSTAKISSATTPRMRDMSATVCGPCNAARMIPAEKKMMPVVNAITSRSTAASRARDGRAAMDRGSFCIVAEGYQSLCGVRRMLCRMSPHTNTQPREKPVRLRLAAAVSLAVSLSIPALSIPAFAADPHPHILQQPSISKDLIAFSYAGDVWTVPRGGGRATHLTTGVGIESQPIFSPDRRTIAFTGEYDGDTDVFTIPATGGIPKRITYHPAADVAVGWTPDGKGILFRSNRDAAIRYTRMFEISAEGGVEKRLPLPTAYEGALSPDGSRIAYN